MSSSSEGFYRGDPPSGPVGAPPPFPLTGYGPPPGFGPPPPGYGPPPGYPPAFGYRRPTNTLAILALVLAFVVAPVGLVLGIMARRQIRETGEEGDGLALAGLIVGAIGTALFVLALLFVVVALVSVGSSFAP